MPYNKQGIETAEYCLRLEMKFLNRQGLFKNNRDLETILYWNAGEQEKGNAGINVCNSQNPKHFYLSYGINNNESQTQNYKINLIEKKSNLGRGVYYYFECPETLKPCRILYLAYGSNIFKSRYAYNKRIYYKLQTLSKKSYPLERKGKINNILEGLKQTRLKTVYKGRETSTYKRYQKLESDYWKFEDQCMNNIIKYLNKLKIKI